MTRKFVLTQLAIVAALAAGTVFISGCDDGGGMSSSGGGGGGGICGICGHKEPPPAKACGAVDDGHIQRYLPADKKCSAVLLQRSAPQQVNVGQAYTGTIRVTNTSGGTLKQVEVWEKTVPNFQIAKTTPESDMKNNYMHFDLGTMKDGESKDITITGTPLAVGVLRPCAEVTFRMEELCIETCVVQPALVLTKTAPSTVLQCDTIPICLEVKNTGSGEACNVVVNDPLPEGWTDIRSGKGELAFNAGTLKPGEAKTFNATIKSAKTGTYTNVATASADGGLRAASKPTTTVVVKPELSVTKTAPAMRYIGRPVRYEWTVKNGPETAAENTVLTDTLPAGATFTAASEGGAHEGGKVVYNLGTLEARGEKSGWIEVCYAQPGTYENKIDVTASCGNAAAKASTEVQGIPAILLEAVDLDDPIEVGAQTTYEICVTNQGSMADTNVKIVAELPAQQEYVRSSGPTKGTASGQTITFEPLPSIAPKARLCWRVVIKAREAGDVRFRVTLTSDQMTTPAMETEATRLYK